MPILHTKFDGQSNDLQLDDLFPSNEGTFDGISDSSIREAAAANLDIPMDELSSYEITRHQNGNATLHPPAEFGV